MTEIKLQCSRPLALMLLVFGLPIFFLVAFGGIYVVWAQATTPLYWEGPVIKLVLIYVLNSVMALFGLEIAWFILRYGRGALFTTYRITQEGIGIENRRYGNLVLAWSDIEAVTFKRPLNVMVLKSPRLAAPIAITGNAQKQSGEFRKAVALIRQHMGERWKDRWI